MSGNTKKILIVLGILSSVLLLGYATGFYTLLTLESIQGKQAAIKAAVDNNQVIAAAIYILLYALIISFGLPILIPLTLLAGYLFGLVKGVLYSEAGSVVGAASSYALLNTLFKSWLQAQHGPRLEKFKANFAKYGTSYLLVLFFFCVIPFFVVNTLAVISSISLGKFLLITAVGSLPFIFICVLAGKKLGEIQSVKEIFSQEIMILFGILALLAIIPIVIQKINNRKHHAPNNP